MVYIGRKEKSETFNRETGNVHMFWKCILTVVLM